MKSFKNVEEKWKKNGSKCDCCGKQTRNGHPRWREDEQTWHFWCFDCIEEFNEWFEKADVKRILEAIERIFMPDSNVGDRMLKREKNENRKANNE